MKDYSHIKLEAMGSGYVRIGHCVYASKDGYMLKYYSKMNSMTELKFDGLKELGEAYDKVFGGKE